MTTTTRTARHEGARWGLQPEQSPMTLIPDWLQPGSPVTAYTLSHIAHNYGDAAAKAVDAASGPCPVCALHTFGAVVCNGCRREPNDDVLNVADDAGYGWHSVAREGRDYGDTGGYDD